MRFAKALFKSSLIGCSGCVAGVTFTYFARRDATQDQRLNNAMFIPVTIVFGVCSIVMCGTRIPSISQRASAFSLEVLVVFALSVCSCAIFWVDSYYLAKFCGWNPHDFYESDKFTDSRVLLVLTSVLATGHAALPVRWCVIAAHEFCGVAVYLLSVCVVGSPEGTRNALTNVLLFTLTTISMAVGKRQVEAHERDGFQRLIEEKSLRFSTEFKLSQLKDKLHANAPASAQQGPACDDGQSLPETTHTGEVFDTASSDQLDGVLRVGKQEHWIISRDDLEVRPEHSLGHGSFGCVIAGSFLEISVAVTVSHPSEDQDKDCNLLNLCNEVRVLRKLRHPRLVFLFGVYVRIQHNEKGLVLEWVDGIVLSKFTTQEEPSPNKARLKLIHDVASALRSLYSRTPKVVHGNLKSDSIFIESGRGLPIAKLLDFGQSQVLTIDAKCKTTGWHIRVDGS